MHAKAIADYDEALRIEPNAPNTYVSRGIEWHKDMEFDKAIADFTRAIELNPKDAFGYQVRATTWKVKREYDKAVKDCSEVVRLDPDSVLGHRRFARLLATCGEPKIRDGWRAVREATRACELSQWNDSACLDTLAAAYAETGDFAAAVKWQSEAIQRYPIGGVPDLDEGLGIHGRLREYKRRQPTRE
jgi:tetratricopeptide (TPR) repeat protein